MNRKPTFPLVATALLLSVGSSLGAQVRLTADRMNVATVLGSGQQLQLDARALHANAPFVFLGSWTGTGTGVRLGNIHIPVDVDAYTATLLGAPNTWLVGGVGTLDAHGRATANLRLPVDNGLLGLGIELHHAAVVLGRSGAPVAASNAVPLRIGGRFDVSQGAEYMTRISQGVMTVDDQGFIYIVTGYEIPLVNPPADNLATGAFMAKLDPTKQGDESIVWSRRFFNQVHIGMAWGTDSNGNPNVYVCGYTDQQGAGLNSFDTTVGSGRDGYIEMFDALTGTKKAGLYLSKSNGDTGPARRPQTMTVRDGFLYLVGNGGAEDLWYEDAIVSQGPGQLWAMKMAADLSYLDWSTLLPSDGSREHGFDIEVDSATQSVYIAGHTESANPANLAGYAPGFDAQHNGRTDGFVFKLGQVADGKGGTRPVPLAYTYLGGTQLDMIHDLCFANGRLYAAGLTESKDFPVTTPSTLGGRSDAFIARLDADLKVLSYAHFFGGGRNEGDACCSADHFSRTIGIAVVNDRLHLTGTTRSADLPATAGAVDETHDSAPTSNDLFVARFANASTTPVLTELTYLGGVDGENTRGGPFVDAQGCLYIAAETPSLDPAEQTSHFSIELGGMVCKLSYDDPPQVPPGAPSGLAASGVSCSAIELAWTDADSLEQGFTIERSPAGAGAWAEIDTVAADVTSYRDAGLPVQTAFDYRVRAFNAFGTSGYSETRTATTLSSAPLGAHVAASDAAIEGVVSGGFTATHASDNGYQSVQETVSGGKPANRMSLLEHRWTIPLPCGATGLEFRVEAHRTDSGEGDAFGFDWSTDGLTWNPMTGLQITKTADDDQAQVFVLPSGLSGTLLVRVRDLDRSAGNNLADTIFVDRLWVQSN